VIPVVAAGEPANFNALVRIPGAAYLASLPAGQPPTFRKKDFWRKIIGELHSGYSGICAYTCHFIPRDTGSNTVEHFRPKKLHPNEAYEWSNYRLVCGTMNGRKGDHVDVVDPFAVVPGMFVIDFPSLQVVEGSGLAPPIRALASSTIKRLKLNSRVNIEARLEYVMQYRNSHVDRHYISTHAPFIHSELDRQNISQGRLVEMYP
jgi:hypothetical protein